MELCFYDNTGAAVAYTDDGDVFLYSGEPVAYLEDRALFALSGQQLGWLEDGWVRTTHGAYVMFTDGAIGGPVKPRRLNEPARQHRRPRPLRGMKQREADRPGSSPGWTAVRGMEFLRP
jgi:hypothetical protein